MWLDRLTGGVTLGFRAGARVPSAKLWRAAPRTAALNKLTKKRKSRLMRSSVVCIALLATTLFAKDPTDWKQGKLLHLDIASRSGIIGINGMILPDIRPVFTYTVDGGDRIYDGREIGRKNSKPIHVEVNAPVQYAVDKDYLYIKDSDGKSHKLDLIRTTRK